MVRRARAGTVSEEAHLLIVLSLMGTFAFALNGALTGLRATELDIVGVVTLGVLTALGGGIVRDVLLGALPPQTFNDWRYLGTAATGGLVAFVFGRRLDRAAVPILLFDAVGLSLFAVTGALTALAAGLGPEQATILGAVTAVGGGTIRDVLTGQVPSVLRSDLYAIPALLGAALVVVLARAELPGVPAACAAASVCFMVRLVGVRFRLNAPRPRHAQLD